MSLTKTTWVKRNCLRTDVGRLGSSMHKWGLASANCKRDANEQTADRIISTCRTYWASRGMIVLTVLDDKQGAGSIPSLPASDLGNMLGW